MTAGELCFDLREPDFWFAGQKVGASDLLRKCRGGGGGGGALVEA